MAVKIVRGDTTIIVEGEDAARLLQHVEKMFTGGAERPTATASPVQPAQDSNEMTAFKKYYRSLGKNPRQVLAALFDAAEGMSDVQLKERLKEHGIDTLAGSMTAIVKGAKRVNLATEAVLLKDRSRDRDTGSYFFYQLGPVARAYLVEQKRLGVETNGRPTGVR